MTNCPVCGKQLLDAGDKLPTEYDEYRMYSDENPNDYTIAQECPIQESWTMAAPFKVGIPIGIGIRVSQDTYPPLTLVCRHHHLKAYPSDDLKAWLPFEQVLQGDLIVSADDAAFIRSLMPEVEGDASEEKKILWIWNTVQNELQQGVDPDEPEATPPTGEAT